MVPGLDYGLGEGEGMVLTEEEEREVMLQIGGTIHRTNDKRSKLSGATGKSGKLCNQLFCLRCRSVSQNLAANENFLPTIS